MIRLLLTTTLLAALYCTLARGMDALPAVDPAVAACDQAVAEGSYTLDLLDQCYDDYRDYREGAP